MRFVAIMKSDQSVVRVDASHSIGRTRRESGRAGYDAFMHRFKNEVGLTGDLGIVGANMFRNMIENCIDDQGMHNGQQISRSVNGQGYLPNTVLRATDGEKEIVGQLYLVLEMDGDHFESDQIMRQVASPAL